uniref:Ubiquitin-like protease family profile domain-containing protein n=1 Tax=Glossina palpalis gambiensis TaxID=67801 RepID=A0A1B0ALC2_9MUSC
MDRQFTAYAKIDIQSSDFQRLVEVYAQWLLRERVTEEVRNQVHLFSPFQYNKITQKSPNWELLRQQASRNKVLDKRCLIIPVCEQSHWRLFVVAHTDVASKKGAILLIDSLAGYPNSVIAANVRQYAAFLNMVKHGYEIDLDQQTMPLIKAPVPRQYNQVDCWVLLLQNLECYLRQGKTSRDPLTLPETWDTGAEAPQTRIKIAAVQFCNSLVSVHNGVYSVGGFNRGALKTAECYDPASKRCSYVAPMNNSRHGFGIYTCNDIIYVV